MKDRISNNRLELQNVSQSFGKVSVLKELSFSVNAGEVLVMVGPSGCGKTTILNLLSGYIEPDQGTIQKTGVTRTVYQQDGLFPWLTVAENIAMGLRSKGKEALQKDELHELIELIHLEGFEDHYPHQLSGGMKQRVELARVLAGDTDILLMDEPFSALDYQTRLKMRWELVRVLEKRPRTVVFVTHDIEEAAQLADRILVLTNRPATISKELIVYSKRPRDVADIEVITAIKTVMHELGLKA